MKARINLSNDDRAKEQYFLKLPADPERFVRRKISKKVDAA
jgi:hypothetical protein